MLQCLLLLQRARRQLAPLTAATSCSSWVPERYGEQRRSIRRQACSDAGGSDGAAGAAAELLPPAPPPSVAKQAASAMMAVLADAQVSSAAMLAVQEALERRRGGLSAEAAAAALPQLQAAFGRELTSDMLVRAPAILSRSAPLLLRHFDGLVDVFGAGRAYALAVVRAAPDMLAHRPAAVQKRLAAVQEMFQVDNEAVLRLVRKAPPIIKGNPEKYQPALDFLAEVAGLSPAQVFRIYTSWPMMATTRPELIQQRYYQLMEMLQASPAEMARICRSWPSLLCRKPMQLAANITVLSNKLDVPLEQLIALVRKEPGLLSWNISTLITRVVAVSQALQLPPRLRVTLLTYNRPLLSHVTALPGRIELLRKLLHLPADQLYSLIHRNLSVMRFPDASLEAKAAAAASLARLTPAWAAEWAACSFLGRMRALQSGWACYWRLVYLVHTGQAGTLGLGTTLRMRHSRFALLYPGFAGWLDRYNRAVEAGDVPLQLPQQLLERGAVLAGPAVYTSVLPDATMGKALHAGSLYAPRGRKLQQASSSASSASSSDVSSSSSSGVSSGASGSAEQLSLPPTQAGWLAAWLGVELQQVQELLQQQRLLSKLTWPHWQDRLGALQPLLALLGHCEAPPGSTNSISTQPPGSPLLPGGAAACSSSSSSSSSSRHLDEPDSWQAALAPEQQRQQQQQQQQRAVVFTPPPEADAWLAAAASHHQSAAVAAVSVACHLVPFATQLQALPPAPAPAVVDFVLAAPRVFARVSFADSCRRVATLAAACPELHAQLAALDLAGLAPLLGAGQPRLRYLHYLVATRQPRPWAFSLQHLLLSSKLPGYEESSGVRAKFCAAYPGYAQWEATLAAM